MSFQNRYGAGQFVTWDAAICRLLLRARKFGFTSL